MSLRGLRVHMTLRHPGMKQVDEKGKIPAAASKITEDGELEAEEDGEEEEEATDDEEIGEEEEEEGE